MSKEEEAAARNIKLVRYTHPSPQNWKSKDGLGKSRSLPVQQKKKSEDRLMDMLKSRSAKFHNLTVNRSLSGGAKDTSKNGKKNQETCFLPMKTPSMPIRPTSISPGAVQKLNMDTKGLPGSSSSSNGSFTFKVKKMLEEQRPQLNSIQKEQSVPHTSPKRKDVTPTKADMSSQGELGKPANDKESFTPSAQLNDRMKNIRLETIHDGNLQRDKIRSQRQDTGEGFTEESRPSSVESRLIDDSASSSTERTTPQAIGPQNGQDSIRVALLKLFKQAESENLESDSATNFRIVQLLQGEEINEGEQEEEEEENMRSSDSEERDGSLQGSIVAFEGELGAPEDSGTSRLEVVYISEEEEEKRPRHKVLPPSSGLLRPASPRRLIPAMKDPMAERRKNDREVAIDALAKLKDRKTFDKETFTQIIEKGVAAHRALEGNPHVSVTNDVCSVNNYETSHAYYYQQFDRRSKLAWISLHEPTTTTTGNEPFKRIWKSELLASFTSCTILFHPINSPSLSTEQQDSLNYQIVQLKKLLQNKFYVKLAGSFDKKVDIVILYGQDEKVLSELLEKKQNSAFRVWSLQKTLDYLQNVGINLREWNIERDAQDRESIIDVPITDDSIQEDVEDSAEEKEEERQEKERQEKDRVDKQQERLEGAQERLEGEQERLEGAQERLEGEQERLEGAQEKLEAKQERLEKEEERLEREENEEAGNGNKEQQVEEEREPEERIEAEQQPPKQKAHELEQTEPGLTKNTPKKVVKSKSLKREEKYVQKLLQRASDALDKRDEQLKVAHNIILNLSRDVMQQEMEITSLTGQLKHSNKELNRKSELAEQYRICMAEQEVEMAELRTPLSKKKSRKSR